MRTYPRTATVRVYSRLPLLEVKTHKMVEPQWKGAKPKRSCVEWNNRLKRTGYKRMKTGHLYTKR